MPLAPPPAVNTPNPFTLLCAQPLLSAQEWRRGGGAQLPYPSPRAVLIQPAPTSKVQAPASPEGDE